VSRDLLRYPDHPDDASRQVDGIPAQARAFPPPQAGAGGERDEGPIPMRDRREELVEQLLTGDRLVVGVLATPRREPNTFARVESDKPVTDCRAKDA
jgi:hypothetical protein